MISTGKGKVTELRLHRENREQISRVRQGRGSGKLILCISVVIVGYIIFSLGNQFNRLHTMESNVGDMKKQVEELKTKNSALREEIKKIRSDSYVEQVAREQLGLVKPGETLVVPTQSPSNGAAPALPAQSPSTNKGSKEKGINIKYTNIYD